MSAECPICGAGVPSLPDGEDGIYLYSCRKCHEAYLVSQSRDEVSTGPADPPAPLSARIAPGSVMDGVFATLDESIANLPTIPTAPQRVIAAAHDPLVTSADLARIINEDATMSMRVLKLANSSSHGGRQKITDLRLACARLGMRNLANVAHVVAHGHLYRSVNPSFRDLMDRLWQHAVATARLAEAFGAVVGGVTINTLFLMGLIHDIGKPVLLDAITNRYKGRLGRLKESPDLLARVLNDFAPYAGLRVAQHWGVATEIRFATYYAAMPGAAPAPYRRYAYLIALSSAAAESSGYGATASGHDPRAEAESLAAEFAEELGGQPFVDEMEKADELIKAHLDA